MKKYFVFILMFLTSITFAAAPQSLYKVSIIVVAHISQKALQSEQWSAILPPHTVDAKKLKLFTLPSDDPNTASEDSPVLWTLLPEDQSNLQNAANKLSQKNIPILLEQSWIQPINAKTPWLLIQGGSSFDQQGQPIASTAPPAILSDNSVTTAPNTILQDSSTLISDQSTTPLLTELPTNITSDQSTSNTATLASEAAIAPLSAAPKPFYWTINGKIRLTKGVYFTLQTQLYLTINNGSQESQILPLSTFLMEEKEHFRLNQWVYIDHPLFGLILKIARA